MRPSSFPAVSDIVNAFPSLRLASPVAAAQKMKRIVESACGSPEGYLVDKMHEIGTMLRGT